MRAKMNGNFLGVLQIAAVALVGWTLRETYNTRILVEEVRGDVAAIKKVLKMEELTKGVSFTAAMADATQVNCHCRWCTSKGCDGCGSTAWR